MARASDILSGKWIRTFAKDVTSVISKAQQDMAETLAVRCKEIVESRIPNKPGWYKLYRDSLKIVVKDEAVFLLAESSIYELKDTPPEKTLFVFDGESEEALVLKRYNPWPVDMIPALVGGISADVQALPASKMETNKRREQLAGQMGTVSRSLARKGLNVEDDAFPTINGKITADLNFMSKRLEHGLGPFSPMPHWSVAVSEFNTNAISWISDNLTMLSDELGRLDGDAKAT